MLTQIPGRWRDKHTTTDRQGQDCQRPQAISTSFSSQEDREWKAPSALHLGGARDDDDSQQDRKLNGIIDKHGRKHKPTHF